MTLPKLSTLYSKLEKSEALKDLKKNNDAKGAFFCAGFFILNFKQNIFEYSMDFRDQAKIYTFKLPEDKGDIILQSEDIIPSKKQLDEIKLEEFKRVKVDIENIRAIVEKQLEQNKVSNKLEELIAVLQMEDNKLIWNLTCMCEGFTIISMHIDAQSGNVIKFEKRNLLDFVSVRKPEKK